MQRLNDKIKKSKAGFTLIELSITSAILAIVVLAAAAVMVGSQKSWRQIYNRTYSDVVTSGHITRRAFEAVVRKASGKNFLIGTDGDWIEVYHYSPSAGGVTDQYVTIYQSGNELLTEYGTLNPKQTISTQTLCRNVTNCKFIKTYYSIQMILDLNDGNENLQIVSSAVMHNN